MRGIIGVSAKPGCLTEGFDGADVSGADWAAYIHLILGWNL